MNVVLIGMPASGKSRLGRTLAQRLNRRFIDTDKIIRTKYGDISKLFKERGEEYFRKIESDAAREAAFAKNAVISTGGGIILNSENMDSLKKDAVTVYIKCSPEVLSKRAKLTPRPIYSDGNIKEVERLLSVRAPLYEKYADETIDGDTDDVDEKIKRLIGIIEGK